MSHADARGLRSIAWLAWSRLLWWVWRTLAAAAATGIVFGTLVALPFALSAGAPLTLMPMAWGFGGSIGAAAGLIAGLLGAGTATLLAPRRNLGRRSAAVVGGATCTLGSLAILIPVYGYAPDAGERPFVALVTAVAAVVGATISPATELRVGRRTTDPSNLVV